MIPITLSSHLITYYDSQSVKNSLKSTVTLRDADKQNTEMGKKDQNHHQRCHFK